jgi:hypothetical protein
MSSVAGAREDGGTHGQPLVNALALRKHCVVRRESVRSTKTMSQSQGAADRYLQLVQEILIKAIYQDRAIDPWSQPTFDAQKRDRGLDWPHQALTMIGRVRLRSLRECCELVLRERIPGMADTHRFHVELTPRFRCRHLLSSFFSTPLTSAPWLVFLSITDLVNTPLTC